MTHKQALLIRMVSAGTLAWGLQRYPKQTLAVASGLVIGAGLIEADRLDRAAAAAAKTLSQTAAA